MKKNRNVRAVGFDKSSTNKHRNTSFKPKRRKRRGEFKKDIFLEFIRSRFGSIRSSLPLDTLPPLTVILKDKGKQKQWNKWYGIFRHKSMNRFLTGLPFFLSITYGLDKALCVKLLCNHIYWYESMVRSKGPVYTVKLFKRVRDVCVRFASDHSFEPINEIKRDSDNIPLKVSCMKPLLTSKDIRQRRAAIHILDIIKLVEVKGDDPELSSIIDPVDIDSKCIYDSLGGTLYAFGKPKLNGVQLGRIIRAFREELERMFPTKYVNRRIKALTLLSDIHMSVRKGPNGPALGTIEEDFLAVSKSGLLEHIEWVSNFTQNNELTVILDELKKETEDLDENLKDVKEQSITSRLSIKYEAWGKTRFFAICDWFSQSALKGLHSWIFRWLSKQSEDGTMSQDSVSALVKKWTGLRSLGDDQGEIYSLDLSKATDRLPATLQREVLIQIFGKEFAGRWYTICTDRNFQTPSKEFVRYSVGQPLGVYSSWAMLALTHHVICRTALRLAGICRNEKDPSYVVIGDDVAMRGKQLSDIYFIIMSTILRVGISPIKGFTPQTSLGLNSLTSSRSISAEIAKRIFIDGEELSVVSPETLKSGWEYPADFPNLLYQMTNRDMTKNLVGPVAPITLAALSYKPKLACTFATFPLRSSDPAGSNIFFLGTCPDFKNQIPWFDPEIVINNDELGWIWKWSLKSKLQSTLDKFKNQYNVYITLSQKPKQCGNRMYLFKTKEYIIRVLVNKAMLRIVSLVEQTDLLNFQGPFNQLENIISALNTMSDFHQALLGKPSKERENLHRMRSRIITQLQPLVLQVIQKAKANYGILLLESGFEQTFKGVDYVDVMNSNLYSRGLLTHERSRLLHDLSFQREIQDSILRRITKS